MTGRRKGRPGAALGLIAEDGRLWRQVAARIKPLSGRDRLRSRTADVLPEESPLPRRTISSGPSAPRPPVPSPKPPAPLLHGSRAGLDRRKAERLSRGQLPIEASLDLHGLRQAEAHRRLEAFLAECQAAGKRCVLVVTGKGLHKEEAGVLRSAVPRWLNEQPNRARVLSFDYA